TQSSGGCARTSGNQSWRLIHGPSARCRTSCARCGDSKSTTDAGSSAMARLSLILSEYPARGRLLSLNDPTLPCLSEWNKTACTSAAKAAPSHSGASLPLRNGGGRCTAGSMYLRGVQPIEAYAHERDRPQHAQPGDDDDCDRQRSLA